MISQITAVIPTNPQNKAGHEEGRSSRPGRKTGSKDYLRVEWQMLSFSWSIELQCSILPTSLFLGPQGDFSFLTLKIRWAHDVGISSQRVMRLKHLIAEEKPLQCSLLLLQLIEWPCVPGGTARDGGGFNLGPWVTVWSKALMTHSGCTV